MGLLGGTLSGISVLRFRSLDCQGTCFRILFVSCPISSLLINQIVNYEQIGITIILMDDKEKRLNQQKFLSHKASIFRYLAPEYVDGGQITHKVDVYAFGLVLLELMTGQRITELRQANKQLFFADWFSPLATLESYHQLLDPSLASDQSPDFLRQLEAMGRAASSCLRRDPESRPQMSKVFYLYLQFEYLYSLSL